ncbi:hypothetical protein PVAP13_8KG344700 [Panicum virgatum]|uniref:HVA22-like protein n=1 Tax=Panicum virgatum TaxID=38727 RepID=A0A8T0PI95_PANVG|nr:hypothetical protein PVAP13_8KG344700 [Panicum virgatum]
MGKLWTTLSHLYSLSGYASVQAMESSSKLDDEQWLAYWILYSFITLMEMVLQSLISWIPNWYELKLLFIAWLVLPNFRGAAFMYNQFVREQVKKHNAILVASDPGSVSNNDRADEDDKIITTSPKEKKKTKRRLLSMVIPKKLRF